MKYQISQKGLVLNISNIEKYEARSRRIIDKSRCGNHGTIYGAKFQNFAGYGWAMQFDGVNDYVEVPHSESLNITSAITIETWFYTNVAQSGKFLVEKGTSTYLWGLYLSDNSQSLSVYIRNSAGTVHTVTTSGNFIGKLFCVMGTFDGRYIKLYVNGELRNTYDWGSQQTIAPNNEAVFIGKWASSGACFNGLIETRVYNRALSANEVKQNYYSSWIYKMLRGIKCGER